MSDEQLCLPSEACKVLGITTRTLYNWSHSGKIESVKTAGGHGRYRWSDVYALKNGSKTQDKQDKSRQSSSPKILRQRRCICYCRVSSYSQKSDLDRQVEFFRASFPTHEIIRDIGSGLNSKRKGFLSLLDASITGDIQEIVVTHKDRLCRFDFELFERIVTKFSNGRILVLDRTETSPEQELVNDLLAIVTVFSARLHGLRSHSIARKIKNASLPDASKSGGGLTIKRSAGTV